MFLPILLLLLALAAVALVGYIRSARRDTHSVHDYQDTMQRLERISARRGAQARRREHPVPPEGVRAGEEAMHSDRRTQTAGAVAASSSVPAQGPFRAGRSLGSQRAVRQGPLASVGESKLRRGGLVAAALVAAATAFALVDTGAHPAHPAATKGTQARRRLTRERAAAPKAASPLSSPTAATPRPSVLLTSSSPGGAVYTVSSASVELSLSAVQSCWVEVRDGSPAGPVLMEGTLGPGAAKTVSGSPGLWLRLGYPAGVTMDLDGTTIRLPAASVPYDLTVYTQGSTRSDA